MYDYGQFSRAYLAKKVGNETCTFNLCRFLPQHIQSTRIRQKTASICRIPDQNSLLECNIRAFSSTPFPLMAVLSQNVCPINRTVKKKKLPSDSNRFTKLSVAINSFPRHNEHKDVR